MPLTAPPAYKGKPIFKNLMIATACSLGGQWTDVNITRWLTQRSGSYSVEMNDSVTHLVIPQGPTRDHRDNPRIKQALKRGAKACHVVTLDWLEDSMLGNKRLSEKAYLLTTLLKNEGAREREAAKRARAAELEERFVNTNLYHLYHDSKDYFRYEIVITREHPPYGAEGQRYILYLFESNAKPHLYWFAAKHYRKKGDSQPSFYRPSDSPRVFWDEYAKFKNFYKKKTGAEWDERLMGKKVVGGDGSEFRYIPPALGRPVGWVPVGCGRPSTPPAQEKVQVVSVVEMKTAEGMAAETARCEQYERLMQDAAAIEEQRIKQAQQAQSSNLDVDPGVSLDQVYQTPILVSSAHNQTVYTTPATRPEEAFRTAHTSQPAADVNVDHDIDPHAMETDSSPDHQRAALDNNSTHHDLHGTSNRTTDHQGHNPSTLDQDPYNNTIRATASLTQALSEQPSSHIASSTDGKPINSADNASMFESSP